MRVVHYLNQFFAGRGGEELASHPPSKVSEAIGAGRLLQQKLRDDEVIVGTVFCGDNHVAENEDRAIDEIFRLISSFRADLVLVGPAFNAGRYGVACALVAREAARKGIAAVSAMHHENPGVSVAPTETYIVETTNNASGMNEALDGMLRLGRKLVLGEAIDSAERDGYLPRGVRQNGFASQIAAERAIEQLLAKLAAEDFETEVSFPSFHRVPPSQLSASLSDLTLGLVTEGSLVPRGNPDHLESGRCTHWYTYPIAGLDDLSEDLFESVHGGFDTTFVNKDPNRLVPLDAMRALEKEGVYGKLHQEYYVTTGMSTAIAEAERIGREIAQDVKKQGIHAVLVTST